MYFILLYIKSYVCIFHAVIVRRFVFWCISCKLCNFFTVDLLLCYLLDHLL